MTCEEAVLLLSGHLDGINTEEEEAQLQAHLAQCGGCRRLLASFQEIDAGLRALETEAPPDLCGNVMEAIRREKPARQRSRRVWPAAAAAAVLVVLIGTGVFAAPRQTADSQAAFTMGQAKAAPDSTAAGSDSDSTVTEAEDDEAGMAALISDDGMESEISAYGEEEDLFADRAVSKESQPGQALSDERSAAVAVVWELLPELEGLDHETLEDGSWLFTLADAGSAEALFQAHPDEVALILPGDASSEVSYALLLP